MAIYLENLSSMGHFPFNHVKELEINHNCPKRQVKAWGRFFSTVILTPPEITKKMAKPKKYYAVRVGHKPGIYTDWKETEQQINGFRGAEFSSFRLKKDAQKYLQQKKKAMTEDAKENDKSIRHDSETVRKETCQNENQEGLPRIRCQTIFTLH